MRMRMLLAIAGLTLTVPALAIAEDTSGSVDPNQQGSTGSMGSSSDMNPGSDQRTGMETGQTGQMGQSGQLDQQSQQQLFRSRSNFDLKGTVASVDASSNTITVNRPNLPPAELTTSNQTKVKLNGRQASLDDLQPGTEIRAKFNLAQDQAVATEVDAKSKGAREIQKGAREMEKGAGEMQRGADEMERRQ